MEEDEDDIYAPEEATAPHDPKLADDAAEDSEAMDEDEEEEEDDSVRCLPGQKSLSSSALTSTRISRS